MSSDDLTIPAVPPPTRIEPADHTSVNASRAEIMKRISKINTALSKHSVNRATSIKSLKSTNVKDKSLSRHGSRRASSIVLKGDTSSSFTQLLFRRSHASQVGRKVSLNVPYFETTVPDAVPKRIAPYNIVGSKSFEKQQESEYKPVDHDKNVEHKQVPSDQSLDKDQDEGEKQPPEYQDKGQGQEDDQDSEDQDDKEEEGKTEEYYSESQETDADTEGRTVTRKRSQSKDVDVYALNLRISDTNLHQLLSKTGLGKFFSTFCRGREDFMSLAEFEVVADKLYKCCLKGVTDLHEIHLRRLIGLSLLRDITLRADPEYISVAHIVHMVWSVMSCQHHFQLRIKSGSTSLLMLRRRRILQKCMDYYLQLIRMFPVKKHRVVLSALIAFYKDGKLWEIDFPCSEMIAALLQHYTHIEEGIDDLLNAAVNATYTSILEGQSLMQITYEVLEKIKWRMVSKTLITRFITMLESSIYPNDVYDDVYVPLKTGIELCIKHLILNISNTDIMAVLKKFLKTMVSEYDNIEFITSFGSLASFAASRFVLKSFHDSFTPDLLDNIRALLSDTTDPNMFLMIIRIWLNLLDRKDNSSKVNEPRIFFYDSDYGISIEKCNYRDRKFFKAYRNYFYELTLHCFKGCSSRTQFNAVFEACALILVEIPCGYTAATFTSLAMSMQEFALQLREDDLILSHYFHATALSILTLICYIHRAEILYQYVANILDCRAEWAPHLMPPLLSNYDYALHHVLWNKPELFFEEWEARYGLWKCFRIKKKKNITILN
ncbi:hypothetical protein NQ315_001617 [Exocentrus adspersus]|uniref:Uncharacterized protein n=1 Tax=Exocentrus adspersus TaxID=1586481 RepID=A0AAV8W989_9CUCU|nr:hypothetical protein NQ315_001617 [Exocentrus adspersus]